MDQKEKLFFDKLKDLFVGAEIEGESGYINLMRIKSTYFNIISKELKKDIDEKTAEFPEFREELFDKLYSFFKTYFSESGAIYFNYLSLKSNVYEKIYNAQEDVTLFWKTHMLYYVKSEKIWHSLIMDFDLDGIVYKIHFDVSKLENKKNNEKKEILYVLKKINQYDIEFFVLYTGKGTGTTTKIADISKELKENNVFLDEEHLVQIFKTFEKQNEVDFFINKDAKKFLKSQFDLWINNFVSDESDFKEQRLTELKVLREISYRVIEYISQFENELVKIWNKPKFVLNSNYVITLDKIANKKGGIDLLSRIFKDENIDEQVKEWKELGIIENFDKKTIFMNFNKKQINKNYVHLPLDTRYLNGDTKLELLSLFEDIDNQLDGWLIHSENYQALNTTLQKFKNKVQLIYIDPPFNTGKDFQYLDRFQDSTWLTLMQNRLEFTRDLLSDSGNLYLHLDRNSNFYGRILLNSILDKNNFKAEIALDTSGSTGFKSSPNNWIKNSESILYYCKNQDKNFFVKLYTLINPDDQNAPKSERKTKGLGWLDILSDGKKFYIETWDSSELNKKEVKTDNKLDPLGMIWGDIYSFLYTQVGNNESFFFDGGQKPEHLLRRIIQASTKERDLVMDFFLGIGTTAAVAHKLNRKWIGIEMGDHFDTFYFDKGTKKIGALGRMKIVLSGDQTFNVFGHVRHPQLSRNVNWLGGGFFKYYDLEQYEQTLKNSVYEDSSPFGSSGEALYQEYVFLKDPKMLKKAIDLDLKDNKINIDLGNIYDNVDVAETISNIKGKYIQKIGRDFVILIGDEKIDFKELNFGLMRPLIWW